MPMLLIAPLFMGFSSNTAVARVFPSGAVQEVVELSYTNSSLETAGISVSDMNTYLETVVTESIKTTLATNIKDEAFKLWDNPMPILEQISVSTETTISAIGGSVLASVKFNTTEIWNKFCQGVTSQATNTTKTTFFLKTFTTEMPIKLSEYNGQTVYEIVNNLTNTLLNQNFGLSENLLSADFRYAYATNQPRLHSNADEKAKDTYGLNVHIWQIQDNQPTLITLWQVRANAVSWYLLALGLTGVFALVLWQWSKKKPQKPAED